MKKEVTNRSPRPLSADFTESTLRRALRAKRRYDRQNAIKELLTMKMAKKPIGALVALAIVVMGGVGVYAAGNWFNGRVQVTQDDSIMTVDLSECKDTVTPGVEPTTDRSAVKFKILGYPHIQPEELQRKLLTNCELTNVTKQLGSQEKTGKLQGLSSALVEAVDYQKGIVTLRVSWGGQEFSKTVTLASGAILKDKGQEATLKSFSPGSYVVVSYDVADSMENKNPWDTVIGVNGMFKTQYDTRETQKDGKSLYDTANIMPLDHYNQINR